MAPSPWTPTRIFRCSGLRVAELKARDWKPFRAAIAAGVPMVMTGHIAVPALEPGVPASLSAPTYAALRGMGFKGVAVTDALNMGAIQQQYPGGSAAPAALAAGADLLLMPADVGQAHAAIVRAVAAGTVPAARLDEAATRVATMMTWRGRVAATPGQTAPGTAPGRSGGTSAKVSAAAVTVLSGRCAGPIARAGIRIAGGSDQDRARFEAAAAKAGLAIGQGPLVTLIGYGGAPAGGDIAVTLDAPWPLAGSSAPGENRPLRPDAGRLRCPGCGAHRKGDGPGKAAGRRRTLPGRHRLPLIPTGSHLTSSFACLSALSASQMGAERV